MICAEPTCDRPTHAKGLCKAHYSAWYRNQNRDKIDAYNRARRAPRIDAECPTCGEQFKAKRVQTYCSDRCERIMSKRRCAERNKVETTCSWCGETYLAVFHQRRDREHQRRYCSPQCQAEGKVWYLRKALICPLPLVSCLTCHQIFVARVRCPRCKPCAPRIRVEYKPDGPCCDLRTKPRTRRWYMGHCRDCGVEFTTDQPAQTYCSPICTKRDHHSRRRRRKHDAHVEDVHRLKVYDRDDWTCRLCGKPVDRDAEVPEHLAPTLDHIVPLALGGDHSYANVQCAHFICNARKSATCEGQLHFAA